MRRCGSSTPSRHTWTPRVIRRSWRGWAPPCWTSWTGTFAARATGSAVDPEDGLITAGRRGSAAHLDGRQSRRLGGHAATRQARGDQCAVVARADVCRPRMFEQLQWDAGDTRKLADQAAASFARRFWNAETGCLYDVVDGPSGDDPAIRPNQVIALAVGPDLAAGGPRRVGAGGGGTGPGHARGPAQPVTAATRPIGASTAAIRSSATAPIIRDPFWSWLLGMYVRAAVALGRTQRDLEWIEGGLERHLAEGAIGTVSEIFQPESPYAPDGAFAQAWGVGEWLWALQELRRAPRVNPVDDHWPTARAASASSWPRASATYREAGQTAARPSCCSTAWPPIRASTEILQLLLAETAHTVAPGPPRLGLLGTQ